MSYKSTKKLKVCKINKYKNDRNYHEKNELDGNRHNNAANKMPALPAACYRSLAWLDDMTDFRPIVSSEKSFKIHKNCEANSSENINITDVISDIKKKDHKEIQIIPNNFPLIHRNQIAKIAEKQMITTSYNHIELNNEQYLTDVEVHMRELEEAKFDKTLKKLKAAENRRVRMLPFLYLNSETENQLPKTRKFCDSYLQFPALVKIDEEENNEMHATIAEENDKLAKYHLIFPSEIHGPLHSSTKMCSVLNEPQSLKELFTASDKLLRGDGETVNIVRTSIFKQKTVETKKESTLESITEPEPTQPEIVGWMDACCSCKTVNVEPNNR